ncbi:MAG: glycoside hydrolase family 18 protein [Anaerolineae bacterium]
MTVTLLSLAALGRGCIFRPATNFPGAHFNRSANAAWLGVEWVNEPHESHEITALANELDRREIRYVFVFASYLRPDGEFNPTYSHAAEFTRALKGIQPGLNVQAWIGLPLNRPRLLGGRHGYVDLGNATTRQRIVEFCADLISQGGFDGVHLDPEPVPTDDLDVLTLLDEVRHTIGPHSILSIATRRIWPVFSDASLPLIGQVAWRASYYREIAKRVDQIVVMTYDSGLPLAELYRQWVRFQVIVISRAIDDIDVDLFFGIPTSEEKTWTHWPNAENMKSGLQGVIDGLNDADARPSAVTGVAIYPYWETDAAEWATYESLWLGQKAIASYWDQPSLYFDN